MRQIQLLVDEGEEEAVAELFEEEGIDHVRQRVWSDGEARWLFEFPVPTDAVGFVLDRLDDADVERGQYTIIGNVETAITPQLDTLSDRFASDFDPLSRVELRSKARDMSQDMRSYLAMILLSALIATAGLLMESPAVVVGSMVIAPIVGPVLTAAVGTTTGDMRMILDSAWYQVAGITIAITGAWMLSVLLQVGGFVSPDLEIGWIDLIAVRVAPGLLTMMVGLASGAAAAYGLATKGPTSLIGVMIAAALIPTAATTGIAAGWNHPRIAIGSLLLVVVVLILINLGAIAVLWYLGYGLSGADWEISSVRPVAAIVLVVLFVMFAIAGGAAYDQTAHERAINQEVHETLAEPEYDEYELVAVRIEYQGPGSIGAPHTVTVHLAYADTDEPPPIAEDFRDRFSAVTGEDVQVHVRLVEYESSP